LNNCVLTGNSANYGGGAAYSALNNCTLTGNSAESGGGASISMLNNCTVTDNFASVSGGGAFICTLNNCTLTGNLALGGGGGAFYGALNNCIVFYNSVRLAGGNFYEGFLNHCCTSPLPPDGVGNFTNAPLFVDQARGNLRLRANSPCINSGRNAFAPAGLDLDGLPRIVGGTVDVGAYEFQPPQSLISYAWLQRYGLPTDGSVDSTDSDSDGMNTWQEWRCLTDPTNAQSVLRLLTVELAGPEPLIRWSSTSGRTYTLERSTNLSMSPRFIPLGRNIPGQPGTTTFADTNGMTRRTAMYRVQVEE
jgi:hypothetical protein